MAAFLVGQSLEDATTSADAMLADPFFGLGEERDDGAGAGDTDSIIGGDALLQHHNRPNARTQTAAPAHGNRGAISRQAIARGPGSMAGDLELDLGPAPGDVEYFLYMPFPQVRMDYGCPHLYVSGDEKSRGGMEFELRVPAHIIQDQIEMRAYAYEIVDGSAWYITAHSLRLATSDGRPMLPFVWHRSTGTVHASRRPRANRRADDADANPWFVQAGIQDEADEPPAAASSALRAATPLLPQPHLTGPVVRGRVHIWRPTLLDAEHMLAIQLRGYEPGTNNVLFSTCVRGGFLYRAKAPPALRAKLILPGQRFLAPDWPVSIAAPDLLPAASAGVRSTDSATVASGPSGDGDVRQDIVVNSDRAGNEHPSAALQSGIQDLVPPSDADLSTLSPHVRQLQQNAQNTSMAADAFEVRPDDQRPASATVALVQENGGVIHRAGAVSPALASDQTVHHSEGSGATGHDRRGGDAAPGAGGSLAAAVHRAHAHDVRSGAPAGGQQSSSSPAPQIEGSTLPPSSASAHLAPTGNTVLARPAPTLDALHLPPTMTKLPIQSQRHALQPLAAPRSAPGPAASAHVATSGNAVHGAATSWPLTSSSHRGNATSSASTASAPTTVQSRSSPHRKAVGPFQVPILLPTHPHNVTVLRPDNGGQARQTQPASDHAIVPVDAPPAQAHPGDAAYALGQPRQHSGMFIAGKPMRASAQSLATAPMLTAARKRARLTDDAIALDDAPTRAHVQVTAPRSAPSSDFASQNPHELLHAAITEAQQPPSKRAPVPVISSDSMPRSSAAVSGSHARPIVAMAPSMDTTSERVAARSIEVSPTARLVVAALAAASQAVPRGTYNEYPAPQRAHLTWPATSAATQPPHVDADAARRDGSDMDFMDDDDGDSEYPPEPTVPPFNAYAAIKSGAPMPFAAPWPGMPQPASLSGGPHPSILAAPFTAHSTVSMPLTAPAGIADTMFAQAWAAAAAPQAQHDGTLQPGGSGPRAAPARGGGPAFPSLGEPAAMRSAAAPPAMASHAGSTDLHPWRSSHSEYDDWDAPAGTPQQPAISEVVPDAVDALNPAIAAAPNAAQLGTCTGFCIASAFALERLAKLEAVVQTLLDTRQHVSPAHSLHTLTGIHHAPVRLPLPASVLASGISQAPRTVLVTTTRAEPTTDKTVQSQRPVLSSLIDHTTPSPREALVMPQPRPTGSTQILPGRPAAPADAASYAHAALAQGSGAGAGMSVMQQAEL